MARFRRLTWDDLNTLTREQLLPRLEAEQAYWARKAQRGMTVADRQASQEFSDILHAAVDPVRFGESMRETAAWIKGERSTDTSFWNETPGNPTRTDT